MDKTEHVMSKSERMLRELGYETPERDLFTQHIGGGVFLKIYIDIENKSYSKVRQVGWDVYSSDVQFEEHLAIHERFKEEGIV